MSPRALDPIVRAFREEPKLRAFALAHFVDDVGVAVAAWASMLLMTNLFTSQAERAKLMLPSLLAFLVGTIVSGPGTGSSTILNMSSLKVSAKNGTWPVTHSNMTTPAE